MRKTVAALLCVLSLALVLCSCDGTFFSMKSEKIKNAKSLEDIADYLDKTKDNLVYSECADEDFKLYFEALACNQDEFFIVENGDEKYILFSYYFSGYSEIIYKVNSVVVDVDDQILRVDIDYTRAKVTGNSSYITSSVDCVLKLDSEVTSVLVGNGTTYKTLTPFDKGTIYVDGKVGIIDSELNITSPIIYDTIAELEPDYIENKYYKCSIGNDMGLMDSNYDVIIVPSYYNIGFVDNDKSGSDRFYVVSGKNSDRKTAIVDTNGVILQGFVDGEVYGDSSEVFDNYASQSLFCKTNNGARKYGVIDGSLNFIIEPIYQNITLFEAYSPDQFYVVENENNEFAVFDTAGLQQTEFVHTSVYEVQTDYIDSLH